MKKKDAAELLRKYRAGTCTEEEKALVESWYFQWKGDGTDPSIEDVKSARERTWQELAKSRKMVQVPAYWYRYAAAACFCATLCLGYWLFVWHSPQAVLAAKEDLTPVYKNDAPPGGNKAFLSLGDGTVIPLDEAPNGKIAEVNGVGIRKTADGQVAYEVTSPSDRNTRRLTFNQISTPRGGQYHVTLPDGTDVWLNAASSLKYPVKFSEENRAVELSGEAYFEVSKQVSRTGKKVPFTVNTLTQKVEVLGTSFNINAYADEATVNTTLLEGAVRVSGESNGDDQSFILKPNQQAVLTAGHLKVQEVDPEGSIAWKNGYFSFERADIKTVMRQLSRWYDLDVKYEGALPTATFSGKVDRNLTLANVLAVLSYTQVNFRIDGKQIIIFS